MFVGFLFLLETFQGTFSHLWLQESLTAWCLWSRCKCDNKSVCCCLSVFVSVCAILNTDNLIRPGIIPAKTGQNCFCKGWLDLKKCLCVFVSIYACVYGENCVEICKLRLVIIQKKPCMDVKLSLFVCSCLCLCVLVHLQGVPDSLSSVWLQPCMVATLDQREEHRSQEHQVLLSSVSSGSTDYFVQTRDSYLW